MNAPSSEFCYRDLVETLHRKVDGVVVPKIESAADLHAVDWLMANLEREFGVEPGTLDLIPQIETAAGVQRVDRILQARSLRPYKGPWRVKRVAFGGADYAHELGLTRGHGRSRARRRAGARGAFFARRRPGRPDRQPLVPFQGGRRLRARARAQPAQRLPGAAVRASRTRSRR